jgi:hypothetical protein
VISELDAAWAAGFFDGEGCVCAYMKDNGLNTRVCLQVGNTNIDAITKLFHLFGGRLREIPRDRGLKRVFVWTLHTEESTEVARILLRYSVVKATQLELYIRLRELVRNKDYDPNKRRELVRRIKEAKS